MKKLNITKEQFNKSRYFQRKYGKLEYVSEKGRYFKTSKGQVLKFNESKRFNESIDNAPTPNLRGVKGYIRSIVKSDENDDIFGDCGVMPVKGNIEGTDIIFTVKIDKMIVEDLGLSVEEALDIWNEYISYDPYYLDDECNYSYAYDSYSIVGKSKGDIVANVKYTIQSVE